MQTAEAAALRPHSFDEFVGQEALRKMLDVRINAALEEGRPLDHLMLAGKPGFGKTSLATVIANTMGETLTLVKMPVSHRTMERVIRRFQPGILFIDEIHAAPKAVKEDLQPVLEDGYWATATGQQIPLPWITVIAATTEPRDVPKPLYDRFVFKPTLEEYTVAQLRDIALGMAHKLHVTLPARLAEGLAAAAGGTPRNVRQLVLATRDLTVTSSGKTPCLADVLELCQLDTEGLTAQHYLYLQMMDAVGGSVGLDTLANLLSLHPAVVRDLEKLLIEKRMVELARTGREITPLGIQKVHPAPLKKVS